MRFTRSIAALFIVILLLMLTACISNKKPNEKSVLDEIMATIDAAADNLTEGQKMVTAAGLSVELIDPASIFGATGYTYLSEKDSEGLYRVGIIMPDGSVQCIYINGNGDLTIPTAYKTATSFHYGVAEVGRDGRRILIDASGRELFETTDYDYVEPWESGLIRVTSWGSSAILDRTGNEVIPMMGNRSYCPLPCGLIGVSILEGNDLLYGILDSTGKAITGMEFDEILYDINGISDGDYIIVRKGGKWGALNQNCELSIPFQFDYLGMFSEGLAVVGMKEQNEYMKYGYINTNGDVVIRIIYDYAQPFQDGKASVLKDWDIGQNSHYLVDRLGRALIGPKEFGVQWRGAPIGLKSGYTSMNIPEPRDKTKREALLDEKGKELTSFSYFNIGDFHDGLAIFDLEHYPYKKGVINKNGTEIVPPIFTYIELINGNNCLVIIEDRDSEGSLVNGRLGLLMLPEEQKNVIAEEPCEGWIKLNWFDSSILIHEKQPGDDVYLINVCDNGEFIKSGFINEKNEIFVSTKYDRINQFPSDTAVSPDGRKLYYASCYDITGRYLSGKYFIDGTGKEVLDVSMYTSAEPYFGKWIVVGLNGKKGVIDWDGNEILPFLYDFVWIFNNGLIRVANYVGTSSYSLDGLFDTSGNALTDIEYEIILERESGDDLMHAVKNGIVVYLDKTGKEIAPNS